MKVFTVSDHHFGHRNVIEYDDRPFDSIEMMDLYMIGAWNSVVSPADMVVHVGDFSFHKFDMTKHILDSLNGIKMLVKGNHDHKSPTWYIRAGFQAVFINEWAIDSEKVVFSHKPLTDVPNRYVNVHGHVHRDINFAGRKPWHRNVCVELCHDYKPMLLSYAMQPGRKEVQEVARAVA